MGYFLSLNLL